MKYLAKFYTSYPDYHDVDVNTSYMMDIFLEEKSYTKNEDISLEKQLVQHAAIQNELQRNKTIIKIQFFKAIPDAIWER